MSSQDQSRRYALQLAAGEEVDRPRGICRAGLEEVLAHRRNLLGRAAPAVELEEELGEGSHQVRCGFVIRRTFDRESFAHRAAEARRR